jgi:hypothetical protein
LLILRPPIIEALNGASVITQHHGEPDGQTSPCSSSLLESLIMNHSHVLSAAILALSGACAQAATDPVALSFERMLNHTPVTTAPAVPANFGIDPLIAAMVVPQRSGTQHAVVQVAKVDLTIGGFDRMLAHTPTSTYPAVPANFGTDPLIAAMVVPLRLWQSGGSSVQFARAATSR